MARTVKQLQAELVALRGAIREAVKAHLEKHHKYTGEAVDTALSYVD